MPCLTIVLLADLIWWMGVAVASLVSGISLAAGAQYLVRLLCVAPMRLLRASG